jgi:cell division protein FtsL
VTLFFVWTRLQNIRLRIDLARLKEREREVLLENNRLKLEWAKLISPRRLEEMGRERFKLRRPAPDQIFVMREPGEKK